jgi:hypothetical protein
MGLLAMRGDPAGWVEGFGPGGEKSKPSVSSEGFGSGPAYRL